MGLVTAAIDEAAPGSELTLSVERLDGNAVLTIGSDAGCGKIQRIQEGDFSPQRLQRQLLPMDLILHFARQFLAANGGRLEIEPGPAPGGTLRLHYPCIAPA